MIPEDRLKYQLTQMAKEYGVPLREYIDKQITKYINVEDCKTFEEMVGRQEAIKMLRKIFNFIYSVEEKKDDLKRTSYK
jgi:hypothetical protein